MNNLFFNDEYADLHSKGYFKGTSIKKYVPDIAALFKQYNIKTAIDWGCGKACMHKSDSPLFNGVSFILYDPYVPEYAVLPITEVDAILLIDVLEHVPELDLPKFFTAIFKRAKKLVIATFCNRDARKTFRDGTNVHVTQKNREWWEMMLAKYNIGNISTVLYETK